MVGRARIFRLSSPIISAIIMHISMNRGCAVTRTLVMFIFVVFLATSCVINGSFPITAEHFSVDTVEKDDPEKSYGEAVFDRISEGNAQRRAIGWKDRAT
jgi:hypothetical protein